MGLWENSEVGAKGGPHPFWDARLGWAANTWVFGLSFLSYIVVIWPSTSWAQCWRSGFRSCLLFLNTGTTKKLPVILELNKASIIYCSRIQDCFSSCLPWTSRFPSATSTATHKSGVFDHGYLLIFKRSLKYHKASSHILSLHLNSIFLTSHFKT